MKFFSSMREPSSGSFSHGSHALIRIFCLMMSLFCGCATPKLTYQFPHESKTSQRDLMNDFEELERAKNAFHAYRYFTALEIYEKLVNSANQESIRRQALYGLACTRFVTALSTNDFSAAYDLWKQWQKSGSDSAGRLDPNLLDPLLKKISLGGLVPNTATEIYEEPWILMIPENVDAEDASKEQTQNQSQSQDNITEKQKTAFLDQRNENQGSDSLAQMQQTIKTKENEIRTLKRKLSKLEDHIKELREQISALDQVHREIEKKKKEVEQ